MLHVTTGWVALERGDQQSLVPQGAACAIDPRLGPGTPFDDGASPALRDALRRFDVGGDAGAIADIIAAARRTDTLTLWHLLGRVDEDQRAALHDRLATLVKPPPGAARAAVIAGDRAALAAWKDALEPLWLFGVTQPPKKNGAKVPVPAPWMGTPMKKKLPR
jgi:hypothetical protein